MSSDLHASHGHDDIHLPPPSWAPVVLGFGLTVAIVGLILLRYTEVIQVAGLVDVNPALIIFMPGLLVFLLGVWKLSSFSIIPEERPSMGVNTRVLGMWVFLASEIMFFSGLIATFLGYQARAEDVSYLLNVPLMTVGTFLLLTSSFGAVSALSSLQQGKMSLFRNWLIATMTLGALFLSIELLEWGELFGHGITTGTLFGSAFYTLTGFHGMHVLIGLAWMGILLVRTQLGKLSPDNSPTGIEVFGLYWHFVDIVWIILFTIIYLI